jgi:hypothetical protein
MVCGGGWRICVIGEKGRGWLVVVDGGNVWLGKVDDMCGWEMVGRLKLRKHEKFISLSVSYIPFTFTTQHNTQHNTQHTQHTQHTKHKTHNTKHTTHKTQIEK